jgi:hypothetical protein
MSVGLPDATDISQGVRRSAGDGYRFKSPDQMTDEQNLVNLVSRGFSSMQEQLRERDGRVSALSEKIIGMEFQLNQACLTLAKMESEIAKTETVKLEMRVAQLETANQKHEDKQQENGKWIKGLVASVIMLLLGFVFNFVRLNLR